MKMQRPMQQNRAKDRRRQKPTGTQLLSHRSLPFLSHAESTEEARQMTPSTAL